MVGELSPSMVVQTVLVGTMRFSFDRWFEAVVNALVGAASVDVLGRWRIIAGDISGEQTLDPRSLAEYERRARAAGGGFSYVFLGAGLTAREGHDRLLGTVDDDLVLVLDPDAIVLVSTVVRMVQSLTPDVGAVDARRIPLDVPTEQDPAMVETTESGGRCLLLSRHQIHNADGGGIAPLSVGDATDTPRSVWPADRAPMRCAGAVVFSARKPSVLLELPADREGRSVAAIGSLLEEVMYTAGLGEARESVARALTVSGPPLLSVVMRTRVLRPEALRDVLLCLAAQSDGRFELLLVVHNGDPEHARRILDDQPEWLKSRTRILTASGGTRSHPLNEGIAAAAGSLVAFLDDDDLVFEHWVESFLDAAVRHPRRVIRASAGVQRVTTTVWPGGVEGHRNESEMTTPYPAVFDLADHLRVNMTPLMAFAFPRKFFAIFGGADESLEVCEDWDLALRAARVLGVSDIPALTAIYRRWSSGRDSYSLHDQSIWERDMARVRRKLDAAPLLVPAGAASDLAQFSDQRDIPAQLAAAYGSSSWRITAPLRATAQFAKKLRQRFHRTDLRGRGMT